VISFNRLKTEHVYHFNILSQGFKPVSLLAFRLAEEPSEALHEASAGRDAEQDGAVHLFPRGELRQARGDALRGDRHVDGARAIAIGGRVHIVWHAVGTCQRMVNAP
jgi:hypothetical protein